MPYDPWTVIGWLLVAILVVVIIAAPIVLWLGLRARRRALEAFEAHRDRVRDLGTSARRPR